MFWAAILGLIGAPVSVFGHYGIYKLLKPYSKKYARLFGIGMLGGLVLGGPGVHMSSLASAFFYKYMTLVAPDTALAITIKFACYFSLPSLCSIFCILAHRSLCFYESCCRRFKPLSSLVLGVFNAGGRSSF